MQEQCVIGDRCQPEDADRFPTCGFFPQAIKVKSAYHAVSVGVCMRVYHALCVCVCVCVI